MSEVYWEGIAGLVGVCVAILICYLLCQLNEKYEKRKRSIFELNLKLNGIEDRIKYNQMRIPISFGVKRWGSKVCDDKKIVKEPK